MLSAQNSGNKYNTNHIYFDKSKITGIKGPASEIRFYKAWYFLRFNQPLTLTEVEAMKSQVNGLLARFQFALLTMSSAITKQEIWENKHLINSIFIFIMITPGFLIFIDAKVVKEVLGLCFRQPTNQSFPVIFTFIKMETKHSLKLERFTLKIKQFNFEMSCWCFAVCIFFYCFPRFFSRRYYAWAIPSAYCFWEKENFNVKETFQCWNRDTLTSQHWQKETNPQMTSKSVSILLGCKVRSSCSCSAISARFWLFQVYEANIFLTHYAFVFVVFLLNQHLIKAFQYSPYRNPNQNCKLFLCKFQACGLNFVFLSFKAVTVSLQVTLNIALFLSWRKVVCLLEFFM